MEEKVLCYNRGCGEKYLASENNEDSCTFHPGVPVFHDAYKGWSCCKKKCTDFTEFLNIRGCTVSRHSNIKPLEPEKPAVDKEKAAEVVEVRTPLEAAPARLPRPPFDSPLTVVKPIYAQNLVTQVQSLALTKTAPLSEEVAVGTVCKHGGCKKTFEGDGVDIGPCVHHPGVPVFHEGLKFWSCCTKRTTEFSAFLEQVGCVSGEHQWKDETGSRGKPKCRHDWHQTATHVIISVYAKKYDPSSSYVKLNPIRVQIQLNFPEDENKFEMDIELRGVIDVAASKVQMTGLKVEIELKKAEPGAWQDLSFPKQVAKKPEPPKPVEPVRYDDEPVDLSDIN